MGKSVLWANLPQQNWWEMLFGNNKNWQNFKRIGSLIFPGIWASEAWGTIECLKKEGSNSPRLTHSLAGMQKSQRLIPLLLLLPPASSFHFSLVTSLVPSFLVTSAFLLSHSGKASPGHFSPSKGLEKLRVALRNSSTTGYVLRVT